MELAGFQRRYLRQRAHPLRPLVHVGGSGVSREVVDALDQALLDHELVKVRLHEPNDKKAMARELADGAQAHLAGLVGHTVILYRAHPEEPKIELPSRPSS